MPDESPALPAITVSGDVMVTAEGPGPFVFLGFVTCEHPSSGVDESAKSPALSISHPLSNI